MAPDEGDLLHPLPAAAKHPSKRWNIASLILGTLALVTSWVVIGIGIGVAAVATGVVARAQARPGTKKTPTAAVGIALGVASIAMGAGVLAIRV